MSGQVGAATDELTDGVTPVMLAAGSDVFRHWFEKPEHFECLAEMPSEASIQSLLSGLFSSMMNPASCAKSPMDVKPQSI